MENEILRSNISGKVVSVGASGGIGEHMIIIDEQGYKHYYGHLQSVLVELEDEVNVNDEIAILYKDLKYEVLSANTKLN